MKDFTELIDDYCTDMRFEGECGVREFESLLEGIGYSSHSALHSFFGDNPGAINAVVQWIQEHGDDIPEWHQSLATVMGLPFFFPTSSGEVS